jgi:DNA-binding NarL/FixJ family response regulator
MTGDAALRVLVVDDHELYRSGLGALLEDEGFDVAAVASGEEAVSALRSFRADVEATRRVLGEHPGVSVLMLTINRDDDRVLEAVRAGASGYLLKDAELDDIVEGIRAAAAGHAVLAPAAAGVLMARLRRDPGPTPAPPGPPLSLSSRERQVLALLARGCDNAEIGRKLFVSPSTVKHHVSRVLGKLGVENRHQAAVYAIRHGLVDDGRGSG